MSQYTINYPPSGITGLLDLADIQKHLKTHGVGVGHLLPKLALLFYNIIADLIVTSFIKLHKNS